MKSGNPMLSVHARLPTPHLRVRVAALAAAVAVGMMATVAAAHASAAWLSKSDANIYEEAFAAAAKRSWDKAHALAAQAKDELPAKVLRWMEMVERRNGHSFEEITRFIEQNPNWPDQRLLRLRAEEAINDSTPKDAVAAWLTRNAPVTTDGMVALGEALLATGRSGDGRETLRRAWIKGNFSPGQEVQFLRRHGKLLTKADHLARLDDLLWRGYRSQAERMLRRVDPDYHPVAVARMRLRDLSAGVDSAIRRVPEAVQQSDPGFMYERLRWRRKKERDEDALEILRNPPRNMVRPEQWWVERGILARRLINKGYMSDAYRVASDHGLSPDQPVPHAEAEWLSGWIALRFLNDREVALGHFERLYAAVSYPISRSRAAYWAGRAAEALKRPEKASEWYEIAAGFDATYYGQLAAAKLGETIMPPKPAPAIEPTDAEVAAFEAREIVRVVRRLHELGQGDLLRPFLATISGQGASPEVRVLAGRLAVSVDRPDLGVVIAREAYYQGIQLIELGYPLVEMPEGEPERALLLAIARQESNFEVGAESHAGALGLMQLMPATARAVARELKTRYSSRLLTSDPAYNLKLGRAYLAGLIERYQGSYVLAIAAYNAGPSAVWRWIRANGDPREPSVDMVDWIEMIPYHETRNYVQRVLENLQIYRQRLGLPRYALLVQDEDAPETR